MDPRIQSFKYVGSGLATIGLAGAGTGAGVVFGSLLLNSFMLVPPVHI